MQKRNDGARVAVQSSGNHHNGGVLAGLSCGCCSGLSRWCSRCILFPSSASERTQTCESFLSLEDHSCMRHVMSRCMPDTLPWPLPHRSRCISAKSQSWPALCGLLLVMNTVYSAYCGMCMHAGSRWWAALVGLLVGVALGTGSSGPALLSL